MKNLVIALFLLCTFSAQSQSWEAKWENAMFQITHQNVLAYQCEVKKNVGIFTDDDFQLVSNRCLTKEGVFRLVLSDDKSTISVYFLEWIDHWTINWLFSEGSPTLEGTLRIYPNSPFTL